MITKVTNYDNGAVMVSVSTVDGQLDGWVNQGETVDTAAVRIEKNLADVAALRAAQNAIIPKVTSSVYYENGVPVVPAPAPAVNPAPTV